MGFTLCTTVSSAQTRPNLVSQKSLRSLSVEGYNERRLETLVDSKSCGCIRNFLFGKEEVTGSILVEGSRILNLRGLPLLILFVLRPTWSLKQLRDQRLSPVSLQFKSDA